MKWPNRNQIEEYIVEDINPGLEMHGGFLEIKDYNEESGVLRVIMGGGYQGCASSQVTLKLMITNALKEQFPGLEAIEDATEHFAGQNPYYKSNG